MLVGLVWELSSAFVWFGGGDEEIPVQSQEMHWRKPVCIIPSQLSVCGVQGAPKVTMGSQRQGPLALPPPQKSFFPFKISLGSCCNQFAELVFHTWDQSWKILLGRVTQQCPWVLSWAGSSPRLPGSCSPFSSFSRETPQPIPAAGGELRAQPCLPQPGCLGVPPGLPSTCSRYVLGPCTPQSFSPRLSNQISLNWAF